MVAVLKPLTNRCIERPTFDNTSVSFFGGWREKNLAALKAYYAALGRSLPEAKDDNLTAFAKAQKFDAFCKVQWDRERGAW